MGVIQKHCEATDAYVLYIYIFCENLNIIVGGKNHGFRKFKLGDFKVFLAV